MTQEYEDDHVGDFPPEEFDALDAILADETPADMIADLWIWMASVSSLLVEKRILKERDINRRKLRYSQEYDQATARERDECLEQIRKQCPQIYQRLYEQYGDNWGDYIPDSPPK